MQIEPVLTATLRDWRRSRFVWGVSDCMLSASDYAGQLTGADPGAAYRGTYDDEAGALAHVEAAGGGAAILGGAMTGAGLMPITEPRRGDVVCAQVGTAQIGGICLGDFCAFRMERGVIELRTRLLTIVGAWRV